MGVFTKSALRLLTHFPSAQVIREADHDAVADIVISRSRGRKSAASVQTLIDTAVASVGVASPAKDLILKQEAALLLHVQEQIDEITKAMMSLSGEQMKRDTEILTSMKGIGDKTAFNFLIELGGDIRPSRTTRSSSPRWGSIPRCMSQVNTRDKAGSARGGTAISGGSSG